MDFPLHIPESLYNFGPYIDYIDFWTDTFMNSIAIGSMKFYFGKCRAQLSRKMVFCEIFSSS